MSSTSSSARWPTVPIEPQVRELVVWGSSGQAKVIAEIAELAGVRVTALFDRDPDRAAVIAGVAIGHGEDALRAFAAKCPDPSSVGAIAAIGGDRGGDRRHYLALFRELGFATPSLIHPSAWVSPSARIGANCQILAHATVTVDAALGEACIVNTAASVDHECRLGDGVHVGPGAHLAGCVDVGADAFIGTGASVLPRIRIGNGATVGAGAVVTRDVPDRATVAGCPARPISRNSQDKE